MNIEAKTETTLAELEQRMQQVALRKGLDDNGLDIAAINPKRGLKYSPNLYRWLTKRGKSHRKSTSRVYRDREGKLWIGMLDGSEYLIGSLLFHVLCHGGRQVSFCYPLAKLGPVEEVADFWGDYTSIGRCAIDPEHSFYDGKSAGRWKTTGLRRECQLCGNHTQILRTWTETIERSRWVPRSLL